MKSKRSPKRVDSASKQKLPGADDYLRRLRAIKGVETDDYTMFDDDEVPTITEFIPTGVLAIDKLIGGANGGWPIGGISECAAFEHVGKSSILDQSIAQCQRMGGVACLIDSEKGRDRTWTALLGVDAAKLIVAPAGTLEDAFTQIERMLGVQEAVKAELKNSKPPPMLIVWDSLGGMPSKAELVGEADDKHMAVAAKVIKMNFRRLTQRLSKLRCALVFTNHFYNKIGMYGGGIEAYGGSGPKYHTDVRIWMFRSNKLEIGNKVVGHAIKITPKKNRVSGTKDPVEAGLIYGAGVDNSYSLFEWGLIAQQENGQPWIMRSGQWYWLYPPGYEPISFQRKFLGLGEVLTANPEVYKMMATSYLSSP